MQHAFHLLAVTLLQLCRAQIPNALPEWYAANLINDAGYQPKPITDIFTTDSSFSTRNSLIVTSTSSTSQTEESTSPPSTREIFTSDSTPFTEETTQAINVIPLETTSNASQSIDQRQQRFPYQPQQIQFLVPQSVQTVSQQQSNQQTTGQPNYVVIYQQVPSSEQKNTLLASQIRDLQSTMQTTPETTMSVSQRNSQDSRARDKDRVEIQPSTESTTQIATQTTTLTPSSSEIVPRNVRQELPSDTMLPTVFLSGPWPNPPPNFPVNSFFPPNNPGFPSGQYNPQNNQAVQNASFSTTPALIKNLNLTQTSTIRNRVKNLTSSTVLPPSMAPFSSLRIRVRAPHGSITNININPSSTTRKPPTPRRRGNNYNNCVDSCRGKKDPICASPLAVLPIDSNNLKGFPSICHLACHNSFRKNQPYEKVADGKCSRLRTRIRTFDKNKLNRDELNKAQYTVFNNAQDTVVEVLQNERRI